MADKIKLEWLNGRGPSDPAANVLLGDQYVGRVYQEGYSYTLVVRGHRRGGYSLGYSGEKQIKRDARKMALMPIEKLRKLKY